MKHRSLIASLCLSASGFGHGLPAFAQDPGSAPDAGDPGVQESATLDEVVVTGPRLARTATPVTVLGAQYDIMGRYYAFGLKFRL